MSARTRLASLEQRARGELWDLTRLSDAELEWLARHAESGVAMSEADQQELHRLAAMCGMDEPPACPARIER